MGVERKDALPARRTAAGGEAPHEGLDAAFWRRGTTLRQYTNRTLRPVEAILLARHRDALAGRVLELGCGGGRLTGYLIALGGEVTGLDVSPRMVGHCRRAYPGGTFVEGDLRDLSAFAPGSLDAIVAGFNVLGVLGDAERRRVVADIHALLVPGGLLILSAHNLACPDGRGHPRIVARDPMRVVANVALLPRRLRNRRRLRALERRHADHAILNDEAHDYSLLHYYTLPDAEQHRLESAGYEVLERLDLDGRPVGPGETAPWCGEIHYVARRA